MSHNPAVGSETGPGRKVFFVLRSLSESLEMGVGSMHGTLVWTLPSFALFLVSTATCRRVCVVAAELESTGRIALPMIGRLVFCVGSLYWEQVMLDRSWVLEG